MSFVIQLSFVCGEGARAATTAAAAAAAPGSTSFILWLSSSWLTCGCLCDTCSAAATTTRMHDMTPYTILRMNLHATQLCCRRSNSGVRCKPSSEWPAACGSLVTTRGYFHLVFRAHCSCCELRAADRAADRAYPYLLLVQKTK